MDEEDFKPQLYMTYKHTLNRIKTATKKSPILVMRGHNRLTYRSVFASTIKSRELISKWDLDMIGVFHEGNWSDFSDYHFMQNKK